MAQKIPPYHVLEMHSSLEYAGGGQRNMVTCATYLNKELFTVFVAAYKRGGGLEEELKARDIEYVVAPDDHQRLVDFVVDKNIDIIHIHRSGAAVPLETAFLQAVKKAKPEICIIEKNVFGRFDPSCNDIIDASMFQSMMHVNERYLKEAHVDFDFDRHKVMYNLVDDVMFERYRVIPEDIERHRSTLWFGPEHFVLGRIGRPDITKWTDLFFDMMRLAIKKAPHVRAVLIGVPPSRVKKIAKDALLSKHIVVRNNVDNDKDLYLYHQSFDALAHTTKIGECNGNTLNEAMFWGKPVITHSTPTKDNGQLEQVIHGATGFIANTPYSFAEAVVYLANNPAEARALGSRGRDFILEHNRAGEYIHTLEKVFVEKLLKRGNPVPQKWVDFYAKKAYYPDEEMIRNYPEKYRLLCSNDYVSLPWWERVHMFLRTPVRWWRKGRDFLEHRLEL